jgi:hypothetical protein
LGTKPNDKIILNTHTPAWIDRHDEAEIAELVGDGEGKGGAGDLRRIAGDLHHYSRYVSQAKDRPPASHRRAGRCVPASNAPIEECCRRSFSGGDAGEEDQQGCCEQGQARPTPVPLRSTLEAAQPHAHVQEPVPALPQRALAVLLGVIYFRRKVLHRFD